MKDSHSCADPHCRGEHQHFHVELATNDGRIDTTRANVYTGEEQNTLVWLVYRNRSKFPQNERALCVIAIPDVGPENTDYPEAERNLGSESYGLLKKVYALFPEAEHSAYANFFDKVNLTVGWDKQIALLRQCITVPVQNLVPVYEQFRDMKGVKRVYMYAITHQQAKHLINTYDQLVEARKKQAKGTGNATSCEKMTKGDLPAIIKGAVPTEIKTVVLRILDSLSEVLPQQAIYFDGSNKESKGGWRVWKSDRENIYMATLSATAVNEMTGRVVIEILVKGFNACGITALTRFNSTTQKYTATLAFNVEALRGIDINKLKAALTVALDASRTRAPEVSIIAENPAVNSPLHTPVKSTTGAAVPKSNNAGDQKRFEKK